MFGEVRIISPECACLSIGIIVFLTTLFSMSTVLTSPCWSSDSLSSRTLDEWNSNCWWDILSCDSSANNHLFHTALFTLVIDNAGVCVCFCVCVCQTFSSFRVSVAGFFLSWLSGVTQIICPIKLLISVCFATVSASTLSFICFYLPIFFGNEQLSDKSLLFPFWQTYQIKKEVFVCSTFTVEDNVNTGLFIWFSI